MSSVRYYVIQGLVIYTNSRELIPSWEATSFAFTQEFANIFMGPEGPLY
jgi:hypothetical protein